MQEILIYGAGGHAKVVIDTVLREGKYTIIGLVDDGEVAPAVLGFQVFKRLEEVPSKPSNFIVAIGDNKTRKQKFEKLKEILGDFVSRIDLRCKKNRLGPHY